MASNSTSPGIDPTGSSSSPSPNNSPSTPGSSSSFLSSSSVTPVSTASPSSSSSTPPPTSSSSSTSPSSTTSTTPSTSSSDPTSTTSTTTTTAASSSTPSTTDVTRTITTSQSGSTTTVVITSTPSPESTSSHDSRTSSSPSSLTTAPNTNNGAHSSHSGGLGTAGVTAVAVVVPVVVVALLVILGIFCWRKRKSKKATEEMRRKEVEDYGFNPNNDPTLPTVASESGHEMSEDQTSGYRGWGAAGASNRKMSTTLSGGLTQGPLSDTGSNAYHPGGSPTGQASDSYSGDALVNRRETMTSDDLGALGAGPAAAATQVRRGPSNASSSYSHGGHSDVSDDRPGMGAGTGYDYNGAASYGFNQHGPYGDGTYGGGADGGMPVVRDVSARRNTRIQQPGNYQQGNSGIAQNF